MTSEITDHAVRILRREPTGTLSASVLHERTTVETGIAMPYSRFMQVLVAQPDRFTIVRGSSAFLNGWTEHELIRYGPALSNTGMIRATTVILADTEAAPHRPMDDIATLLRDVRGAVTDLLRLEDADDDLGAVAGEAILELEQLRGLAPR